MRSKSWAAAAAAAVVVVARLSRAHPSGLADGRASCGAEYHTSTNAYTIYALQESWYLRRIQTCETPLFWSRFTTTKPNQKITMTAVMPQIDRFPANTRLRGIIFGHARSKLPVLTTDRQARLPKPLQDDLPSLNAYELPVLTSQEDICAQVDKHMVMGQYNEMKDGKCVEHMAMDETYENAKMAGVTFEHYWLYGAADLYKAGKPADGKGLFEVPGEFYMVTWLESAEGELVTGKYEITIAPHIWFGYADKETTAVQHAQISTCTCGNNYPMFTEQALDRVGFAPAEATQFADELPYEVCTDSHDHDHDHTHDDDDADHTHSNSFEWGAIFDLGDSGPYTWTFTRKAATGGSAAMYGFDDEDCLLAFIPARSDSIDEALPAAENLYKLGTTNDSKKSGDTVAIKEDPLMVKLDFDLAAETTVLTIEVTTPGKYVVFTQHNANEFITATSLSSAGSTANDVAPVSKTNFEGGHSHDDGHTHRESSRCFAAEPVTDLRKLLEWSGWYNVPAGTYKWILRAERVRKEDGTYGYAYHEQNMKFFLTDNLGIDRVTVEDSFKNGIPEDKLVFGDGTIVPQDAAQQIRLEQSTATKDKATTTFKIAVTGNYGFKLFTQHLPWEFASIALVDSMGKRHWPYTASDYVLEDAPRVSSFDGNTGKTADSELNPANACGDGTTFNPSKQQCVVGADSNPTPANACGEGTTFDASKQQCVIDCEGV